MRVKDLYSEIVGQLEGEADVEFAKMSVYSHKTSGHKSHGVRIRELREMFNKYASMFRQLCLKERLELARMFFRSGFDEECIFGNVLLEKSAREIGPARA